MKGSIIEMKKILLLMLSILMFIGCSSDKETYSSQEPENIINSEQLALVNNINENVAWLTHDWLAGGSVSQQVIHDRMADIFTRRSNTKIKLLAPNSGLMNSSNGTLFSNSGVENINRQSVISFIHELSSQGKANNIGMQSFIWLNMNDAQNLHMRTSGNPNQTMVNVIHTCMKFLFYDDELLSFWGLDNNYWSVPGHSPGGSYLGTSSSNAISSGYTDPAYPQDAIRFRGCVYDFEGTGNYNSSFISDYQNLTKWTYYNIDRYTTTPGYPLTQAYKYGVFIYGLKGNNTSPTFNNWKYSDIVGFIQPSTGGVTGILPGLYNSGAVCWGVGSTPTDCLTGLSPYNSFISDQLLNYYLPAVNNTISSDGYKAYFYPSVGAYRENGCSYPSTIGPYTCSHDPNIENTKNSSTNIQAIMSGSGYSSTLISGGSVYIHSGVLSYETQNNKYANEYPLYAQYGSTSPWHDWSDFCTYWVGTSCPN